ncbi:MAG: hypothetical protein AAF225_07760 [Pseudomonadota bacterium]
MDDVSGVTTQWNAGSPRLMVALSGFASRYRPWDAFHFQGLTKNYTVNKLFLRDPEQAWYHRGIHGVSRTIDETAAYVAGTVGELGVERTVAIGVSSGGYGALLLGWLLDFDEVHAIAPQSYVDIDNRIANDDYYMDEQVANIYTYEYAQSEYFDLKPLFESDINRRTAFHIHYCDTHRLDTIHAERLEHIPNVTLHRYAEGGHKLTPLLTRNGKLDEIISSSLQVPPAPARRAKTVNA